MQTISHEQLETVTGGMTVPGGPNPIPRYPNGANGVREGYRGWTESRQQGQGVAQSGWNAAKRGFQGLWK